MKIELYTRKGCHLCDEAERLLRLYGLAPQLIDIDQRPDLLAGFSKCVPVVLMDDKVRFRGKIDRMLLERLLGAES